MANVEDDGGRINNLCMKIWLLQLVTYLLLGILKNDHGVQEDEENFEEAIKNVNTAVVPTKVQKDPFAVIL